MDVPLSQLPSSSLAPVDTPPSPGLDINADRNPRVVGVAAFLFVISFSVVSLRFVGRYLSKAGIWWDDWLCLAAMLVAWGTNILCFVSPGYNFGKHEAALSMMDALDDTEEFFKALYAYETLYTIAIALAKYSIILFYGRIFTEGTFRRFLWGMSGIVTIWYIAVQIVQLVQCRPLSALWDGSYAENCIDVVRMFVIAGAINCVFNFILLVMPLPMVWGLEIDFKAKIGLSITFLLGVFVFAVSAARVAIIANLNQVDVTWSYVDAAIWTTVEPNIAVVSASLPILRSLWILLNPHRSIHTRSTVKSQGPNRGGGKSRDFERGPKHTAATEKTVVFADKDDSILQSPSLKSPANSLFRGLSTRTKQSFHHNTPVSSAYGASSIVVPSAVYGNELVSPIYGGSEAYPSPSEYVSAGGFSDISGPATGGLSRKPTVGGRSEDSMTTPLTGISELSAHRSAQYGDRDYARYTANVSAEKNQSKRQSIASRMGVGLKSPKVGSSGNSPHLGASLSPRVQQQQYAAGQGDEEAGNRGFEMRTLPIQGSTAPKDLGPARVDRSQAGGVRRGQGRDSGSLNGYPPAAELYA